MFILTTGMQSSEKLFASYASDDMVLTTSCHHVVKVNNDKRNTVLSMAATISLAAGSSLPGTPRQPIYPLVITRQRAW